MQYKNTELTKTPVYLRNKYGMNGSKQSPQRFAPINEKFHILRWSTKKNCFPEVFSKDFHILDRNRKLNMIVSSKFLPHDKACPQFYVEIKKNTINQNFR